MKRISSGSIGFQKRWFLPLFSVMMGLIALCALVGLVSGEAPPAAYALLLLPAAMVGVVAVLTRTLVSPLADEVLDGGGYLLVRKGALEDRVPLIDIVAITSSTHVKPPRVTLHLARPGPLGDHLVFAPLAPMITGRDAMKIPLVQALVQRVDAARQGW